MDQKLCVVTGASNGIGLETAVGLAKAGMHVVMAARNSTRGEDARKKVWAAVPGAKVDLLLADFASLEEVRRLADTILKHYDRLNVLVNNAGLFAVKRELSRDGFEMTWAVNHLAPFLLTNLLLERLKAAPGGARIVNVASVAHKRGHIDFNDLQFEKKPYRWLHAYSQSKLANILFTRELARRLAGTGVTANALHPGLVATNIAAGNIWSSLSFKLARPFLISPAKGARTSLYLATSPEVAGISGEYFVKEAQEDTAAQASSMQDAVRLWDVSAEMVGLKR